MSETVGWIKRLGFAALGLMLGLELLQGHAPGQIFLRAGLLAGGFAVLLWILTAFFQLRRSWEKKEPE
jgi:hypothetical protein